MEPVRLLSSSVAGIVSSSAFPREYYLFAGCNGHWSRGIILPVRQRRNHGHNSHYTYVFKGQVVIPETIRKRLGLYAGTQFIVVGEGDVVILKAISTPQMETFDTLIQQARKQAKAAGLGRGDISSAVSKVRRKSESCHRYERVRFGCFFQRDALSDTQGMERW